MYKRYLNNLYCDVLDSAVGRIAVQCWALSLHWLAVAWRWFEPRKKHWNMEYVIAENGTWNLMWCMDNKANWLATGSSRNTFNLGMVFCYRKYGLNWRINIREVRNVQAKNDLQWISENSHFKSFSFFFLTEDETWHFMNVRVRVYSV